MADKKNTPKDMTEQASKIQVAWTNLGGNPNYGGIALSDFNNALDILKKTETTIQALEDQLTSLRNQQVDERYNVWTYVKRVRDGAKSLHGDDSDVYERFGGTRMSERSSRIKAGKNVKPPKA